MKDFKNIVGSVKQGEPATIRFYGEVNERNCTYFNYEMVWLMEQKPSSIRIMINSEGGNVIHGMSSFSVIQDCEIPTECVIEGLAASMGSILWAAGDSRKMRDYSILMMHNPFYDGSEDEKQDPALRAFTKQLRSIYVNKFGLDEETVKLIMDGKSGEDGTWLDHKTAVKYGIIEKDDVIDSAKGKCKKMRNLLSASASVKDICNNVTKELIESQPNDDIDATIKTEENKKTFNENMENLSGIAAIIGLDANATQEQIFAKLPELVKAKTEIEEIKSSLDQAVKAKNALDIKVATLTESVENFKNKLEESEAKLSVYAEREAVETQAKIESLIDNSIKEGKIKAESREKFIKMATMDFETVKESLEGMEVAAKISAEIKEDENKTEETAKDAAKEAEAMIAKAVGENFTFKKLQ